MKRDIKEALIVTIIICTGLTSCDNEFDPTKIDTPMVKGELVSDDIRMKIELNLDTTVFFIDNMDDINALLEKVSQAKAFELEHKGWKKAKQIPITFQHEQLLKIIPYMKLPVIL